MKCLLLKYRENYQITIIASVVRKVQLTEIALMRRG